MSSILGAWADMTETEDRAIIEDIRKVRELREKLRALVAQQERGIISAAGLLLVLRELRAAGDDGVTLAGVVEWADARGAG